MIGRKLIVASCARPLAWGCALAVGLALLAPLASAEHIKLGIGLAGNGPTLTTLGKGYFADEGLDVEMVYFQAAEPVAVAVVSGAADFGVTGLAGAAYSLAGQGALKIVAASVHEAPGFQNLGIVLSNRAYDAGWRSLKDLAGHSVSVPQIGSPSHYSLALLAEKYHVDLKLVSVLPLQAVPNQISSLIGGQSDAAVIPATPVMPVLTRGDAKLLAWVGDETPWQIAGVFIATKTANERHDTVERFLRAFRKGARDFHDAFTGPDGKRKDGPGAQEILALLAKYTGQTPEQVRLGISYVDPEARLDVNDILHQIAWYQAQGMVKGPIDGAAVIDARYVVPLPPH